MLRTSFHVRWPGILRRERGLVRTRGGVCLSPGAVRHRGEPSLPPVLWLWRTRIAQPIRGREPRFIPRDDRSGSLASGGVPAGRPSISASLRQQTLRERLPKSVATMLWPQPARGNRKAAANQPKGAGVCGRQGACSPARRDYSPNADVWAFRRDWLREKEQIKADLPSGNYRFSLLTRITLEDGEETDLWSARDALVLKAGNHQPRRERAVSTRACSHQRLRNGASMRECGRSASSRGQRRSTGYCAHPM